LSAPATVLIAVNDGVLADSLRFALKLEGLDVNLCDEFSLPQAIENSRAPSCILLDQEVFTRVERTLYPLAERVPIILMTGHETARLVERAKRAGVAFMVETPLMGAALFDAITATLKRGPGPQHLAL